MEDRRVVAKGLGLGKVENRTTTQEMTTQEILTVLEWFGVLTVVDTQTCTSDQTVWIII